MWIDYGGVYFNDVDGNVIEKEEFDKNDDDFDDYYDYDFDDVAYGDDRDFFDSEALATERIVDEAIERGGRNEQT